MRYLYRKICIFICLLLFLVPVVCAEGSSIFLDKVGDQPTEFSGTALIFCSIAIFIFAALIIIKILLMSRGD